MREKNKKQVRMDGLPRVPTPINHAEAVIDPFWDKDLAPTSCYVLRGSDELGSDRPGTTSSAQTGKLHSGGTQSSGAGEASASSTTGATPPALGPFGPDKVRATQAWCWLALAWDRAARTNVTPVLSFCRDLRVDLTGYDRLIVRMFCPRVVHVTLRATVDGAVQTIIDNEPGRGSVHEFEGAFAGCLLEHIDIELSTTADGPNEVWLDWIGCARKKARREMLKGEGARYRPDWDGYLLPEGAPVGFEPRFGFFFDSGDLPALRRKARSDLYRPIMDRLRETARAAMSAPLSPEQQIGELVGAGDNSTTLVRERDLSTRSFHTDAPICALVGLVDEDQACLRFAARIAVSLAHSGSWAPHFMQEFPGTTWEQRGFPEAFTMAGAALALDWAGAWFTRKGEDLVRHAIALKGLPLVRVALLKHEYMWLSNQSHMIALGRLLGLLVLEREWPRTSLDIDVFEHELFELIDLYINADGSTDEGLGYWSNSFRITLPALVALARYRGKELAEVVPPKLRSMDGFVASFLSTAGEPGSFLPISDTVGDTLALDAVGMMQFVLDSPLWRGMMGDCLRHHKLPKPERWSCDGPFAVIHGPESAPESSLELPAFSRLDKAGHISSFRRIEAGPVRMFLVGGPALADHSHRDKGSLILEAGGEIFGADRGMVPYEDSDNVPFMKSEGAHNLAVPEGCLQRSPSPAASVWIGKGDDVSLEASIDTGATWFPPVLACRRSVTSASPERIEICDEFELAEDRRITFYLQSPLQMTVKDQAILIAGEKLMLTVSAEWCVDRGVERCGVDWNYTPMNRLALVSAPARRHRLATVLQFSLRENRGL